MDSVYATALLVPLLTGSLALALLGRLGPCLAAGARPFVLPLCAVACACLAASFVVHLGWGHAANGPAALPLAAFLAEHPAFVPDGLLPTAALCLRGQSHST